MKYIVLRKLLQLLIYLKRALWWTGAKSYFILAKFFGWLVWPVAFVNYKISYLLKRAGITQTGGWLFKRDFLQIIFFLILLTIAIPHTKLYAQKDTYLPGQKTIAFSMIGSDEDFSLEEITAQSDQIKSEQSIWRQGALGNDLGLGVGADLYVRDQEMAIPVAGGTAYNKPILMPGAVVSGRTGAIQYIIEPGDSLGGIAYKFGVSVATILWENGLTERSVIQPGQKLTILPTTGLMHTIKKGDNLKKIATAYNAKMEDIIKFNKLKEDGTDLIVGEKIMIPDGVKQAVSVPRTSQSYARVAVPMSSKSPASARGFVWPSGARMITQYYNWSHHAIDIAGPMGTPNYAAKAGTVVTSQCGWNSGYGCYIIIDHGGGVRTLYGHHSKLLVSAGDHVVAGQTIGLMGNTGKVRGVTGIHLHFEIQINGVRVNPLGYVR